MFSKTAGFRLKPMPVKSPATKSASSVEDDVVREGKPDVKALREVARVIARAETADAVRGALDGYDGTLRDLEKASGLDPGFVSKLANGGNMQGGTVASLAQVALALGKTLRISID